MALSIPLLDITSPDAWLNAAQVTGIALLAYLAILWVVLVTWTYRDIQSRTGDSSTQFISVAVVAVFSVPGLLLYLALRPRETTADQYARTLETEAFMRELEKHPSCPECARPVEADFAVCPFCRASLRTECEECGESMDRKWVACAFCGADPARRPVAAAAVRRPAPVAQPRMQPAASAAPAVTIPRLSPDMAPASAPPLWAGSPQRESQPVTPAASTVATAVAPRTRIQPQT